MKTIMRTSKRIISFVGLIAIAFILSPVTINAQPPNMPPIGGGILEEILQQIADLTDRVEALEAAGGGGGGYAIYDSTDTKVGDLISHEPNWVSCAAFSYAGDIYPLWLYRDGYLYQGLSYTGYDCTGTPYFPARGPFLSAVVGPGNNLYVENGPGVTPFTACSFWQNSQSGCINYAGCNTYSSNYVPVTPLVDLDTLFTPPFHVEKQ